MLDLKGKHIFVAGGSRGIGAAAARMAAQAGAAVTINYVRNEAAAFGLATEIATVGGSAWPVKADISVPGQVAEALSEAVKRQGPLAGLVVSAGVFEGAPLQKMTP